MSQPWHDHPDLGWASYVVTDDDPDLAEALADKCVHIAERCCTVVGDQRCPASGLQVGRRGHTAAAIARAAPLARRLGAVFFADISDAVTAGSTGENTEIIRGLIRGASDLTCLTALRLPGIISTLHPDQSSRCHFLSWGSARCTTALPAAALRSASGAKSNRSSPNP